MNIVIISLIESALYYICMIGISVKILNAHYHKVKLGVSLLIFVPLIIGAFTNPKYVMVLHQEIFQIIEIVILRLCLSNITLSSVIYQYILLFFLNLTIISCCDGIFSVDPQFECYLELSVNILLFALCMVICHTNLKIKFRHVINMMPKNTKILLLLTIICCAVLSVLITNDYLYRGNIYWNITARILLLLLIILMSFVFPILIVYLMTNKHMKNLTENYEKQIKAQSEHYILLSQSNFEMRRFRHDYKNMCIGLRKLISEGKNDEALEMLDKQNLNLYSALTKFDTGNGIVDALLTDKQNQADKIHTKITFEGAVPPDAIKPTDLCIIFGNTLDNAIEACTKMDSSIEKIISVSCLCSSGFIFINVTNPVKEKVEISGNLPTTTKDNKEMHGFGLYSLEKIVKSYSGELSCECDENIFQTSIEFSIHH